MEHLTYPELEKWEGRREWFEAHLFDYEEKGSYLVGEQASAFVLEVQSCFCAGAWAAVIILTFVVIEATLQETSGSAKRQRAVDLLQANGFGARFDALRKRRNAFVHATPNSPTLTIDDQWDSRQSLESEARDAVKLMFEAFYWQACT